MVNWFMTISVPSVYKLYGFGCFEVIVFSVSAITERQRVRYWITDNLSEYGNHLSPTTNISDVLWQRKHTYGTYLLWQLMTLSVMHHRLSVTNMYQPFQIVISDFDGYHYHCFVFLSGDYFKFSSLKRGKSSAMSMGCLLWACYPLLKG